MTRFLILLGGELEPTPRLLMQVRDAHVIAADSGMRHAKALGVTPELWMGDFDSTDNALRAAWPAVRQVAFPPAKNMTDGEIAVAEALKAGADEIVLAGAFGGPRADHAFLHLTLAIRLAEGGTSVLLTSGAQEGRPLLAGDAAFDYGSGTLFSVLAFSDLTGLTIEGARWPLSGVRVPFGSSLTLSNVIETRLRIRLEEGKALLLAHPVQA
ncbi:MAG: thiamine diphosphokinase [Methylobacterium mesophilicum]|nr:thiamine diphosphokinase [Methylobacterium mesophilicum]